MAIASFFTRKKARRFPDPNRRSLWERLFEDAYVGWAIILLLSAVVALTLIGLSAETFLSMRSIGANPSAAPAAAPHDPIDPSVLSSLLSAFQERASTTASLQQTYDGPPDPSL